MIKLITLRIFTNGGIVSLDDLQQLTHIARMCSCEYIIPGFRQELYLQIEEQYLARAKEKLDSNSFVYALVEDRLTNIVTSFVALDIFPSTAWLVGDTYLDILDSFTHQPGLQINIVDPLQNLVPLFSGELNFIASTFPRYWYLYLNFAGFDKRQVWPVLIDGDDIGNLSGLIEGVFLERQPNSLQELLCLVNEKFTGRSRPWEHELRLPEYTFPVLEGLHKTASTWWLGIYRRNYTFPLACLEAMAQLCAVTKIGKIDITPHKTILIKGIREQDCLQWKKLLGLYGVNSRHSIVELNWQLPDLDSEALELKKALVNELEEKEVCTAGMSFAIETRPIEVATSVLIKPKFYKEHEEKALYTIQHTVDFSAHTSQWQMFADQVDRHQLAPALLQLCQVYYRQLGTAHASTEADEIPLLLQTHNKYQCPDCLTVYDPLYGDASSGIVANVAFDELPDVYSCSMCESPKANFVLMSSHEL